MSAGVKVTSSCTVPRGVTVEIGLERRFEVQIYVNEWTVEVNLQSIYETLEFD